MQIIKKTILMASCSLLLSSCFLFDKDNTPTPAPIPDFTPEVSPVLHWTSGAGAGTGDEYLKMPPSIGNKAVFISGVKGSIAAIDKNAGRKLWQTETGLPITTGTAAGEGLVVAASRRGDVIAVNQETGQTIWKISLTGEILATPAIGSHQVVVKMIDGHVYGLSAADGHQLWSYQQTEPALILRGASTPIIRDRSLIIGFANGNLSKLSLDGQLAWTQALAIPEGAFAIQRMIDVDADPVIYDHRIYAATYQGRINSLDWTSGRTLWSHDISSYTGMIADSNAVYISDAKSHLWAFNADTGLVNWRQIKLEYRIVSGPAVMGNYVVVGDAQGYLFWLDKKDGHFVAKANAGAPIYAAPVVENNVLYAVTNKGALVAYTLS